MQGIISCKIDYWKIVYTAIVFYRFDKAMNKTEYSLFHKKIKQTNLYK